MLATSATRSRAGRRPRTERAGPSRTGHLARRAALPTATRRRARASTTSGGCIRRLSVLLLVLLLLLLLLLLPLLPLLLLLLLLLLSDRSLANGNINQNTHPATISVIVPLKGKDGVVSQMPPFYAGSQVGVQSTAT